MLVELYYHIDEFCKIFKKTINKKVLLSKPNARNRECRLSLSEIMTICVYYHYSGYKTFKDYYCKHVLVHLRKDFRVLVSYNRFVELKSTTVVPLSLFIQTACLSECTGVSFIDSCSLKVCHNKRIHANKVFKNVAKRGKTSMGWFYGFKLHLVINHYGELANFCISPGNVPDNNESILTSITNGLFGKLFGDKGYILRQEVFEKLYAAGIHVITKLRANMKNKLMPYIDKILLKKRGVIESTIGILKETFSIEHTRHRSPTNFLSHILSAITAYAFKPNKPSIALKQQQICSAA